jgi:hypothetical protein
VALGLLLALPQAAEAADDPFVPFLDTTLRGGLAVAATCIDHAPDTEGGPTGGTLVLDTVPPGAAVVGAWLYYSVLSDQFPVPAGSPAMDGRALVPVSLGNVRASPCMVQLNTGVFRADVGDLVTGNAAHVLSGFLGNGTQEGDLTEGATLFVVYCDPASPLTDVVIWDGVDVVNGQPPTGFTQVFGGFLADPGGPVQARLAVAAGNGQNRFPGEPDSDPFLFNGIDLDMIEPGILSGGLCPPLGLYDLTVVDVSRWLAAGRTSASLSITTAGDCYSVGAIALAVRTDPARTENACASAACRATVAAPARLVSCHGAAVDLDLSGAATDCPLGRIEISTPVVDPISARDFAASSDLAPALPGLGVARATLTWIPGGDTDLVACVELALVDPAGASTVLKAPGAPPLQTYDVTTVVAAAGPGTWSVRLTELGRCGVGTAATGTAVLTGVRLVVEEDAGMPVAEFRVETTAGDLLHDWSTDAVVPLAPAACPGSDDLVVRARCVFDPSCETSAATELACGAPRADFSDVVACGSQEACLEDATTGGAGALALEWDLAGEAVATEAAPCFTFAGAPPWSVTLRVTDALGCTSSVMRSIAPPGGAPPLEPSALDLAPGAEPLRVARVPAGLRLTWEDAAAAQVDHAYRGFIGTWYSHAAVAACALGTPEVTLPGEPGDDLYFLVAGAACDGRVSSVGRRSDGVERPAADPACP